MIEHAIQHDINVQQMHISQGMFTRHALCKTYHNHITVVNMGVPGCYFEVQNVTWLLVKIVRDATTCFG